MPNIKSAIKRVKTNERLNTQNAKAKSAMRTAVKKADTAALNNDENAKDLIKTAIQQLEKAASKGLIHKNAASRKKSQLMKKA
ncbi:SSU ribosomal protein S20P [Paenisporosarcina quisquiliarum]|uniref:Small ribosomal subunit protein bS20 n=1 Tax=Psychrobacillus psychrodurans TaxID=126157 RepID=A0A9X3LBV4_9BACI|nr:MULTISPECIES: 30S ribosomal protein S20 [Psychrobacillus]SEM48482.1 SSU ribosomal protein S20P [Paenisporosarcina quisquiliarum]MCK1996483.1 30S ribosomal protein S20 [Psychrobacillus psychrodurans]MCZ8534927.1 30S ribosomal protein S20 [Psychrobacillus psychrodurans]MCZ8541517.1 30S ribosomal protein S20 [Psychrobacillus psychrodurans]QUG42164.1 30S ribosomal protein S20 [Psychrobacillus sp. INOP01]